MTRLTTLLIYPALFLALVNASPKCHHNNNRPTAGSTTAQGTRRASMLDYVPDLLHYYTSYNRLMNRGNLQERRPFMGRRSSTVPESKRGEMFKSFMTSMGLGGNRRNSKEEKTFPDVTRIPCSSHCLQDDLPVCAVKNKWIAEFPNECEFLKKLWCGKKFHNGWKILNRGECPKYEKIEDRLNPKWLPCHVSKVGDEWFVECPELTD